MKNKIRLIVVFDMKVLYLFFSFLIIPGSVGAGKIYKWVDEQGKVHFSSNAQFAKPKGEIENIKIKGVSKNKKYRPNKLKGSWFSDYKNKKYELSIKGYQNIMFVEENGDGYKTTIFTGKWKKKNGNIHITYHAKNDEIAEIGKTDVYKIITLNNKELVLLFPNKKLREFFKFDNRQFSRRGDNSLMGGVWKVLDSDVEMEIYGNRFNIREIDDSRNYVTTQYYISSQGEWEKSDNIMTFTYLGRNNYNNKIGSKKTFKIIFLDKRKLSLQNPATGITIKYEKTLLD